MSQEHKLKLMSSEQENKLVHCHILYSMDILSAFVKGHYFK